MASWQSSSPPSEGLGIVHGRTVAGFSFAVFYRPKGHLSHAKRPPFTTRKTAFRKASDYQPVTKGVQTARQEAAKGSAGSRRQAATGLPDGKPQAVSCAQTNIAFFRELYCQIGVFS